MVAEIQKLEAAARMAMGSFEGLASIGETSVRPRLRFSHLTYALIALAVVVLAIAVL